MLKPTPFFFGPSPARLFGWLHAAQQPSGLGMVICNPFGFEEVCAHRSLAYLAEQAATSGVPSLRFDYAGCGNSSGDELDPDTLARWIASIHQAVDTLKQHTGVQRVCLVGLRLGSSLATLAAMERDDVEALVCIAPVVQGRLYVRELRILLASGATQGAEATPTANILEAAGFFMTDETAQALSAVDLRKPDTLPAGKVLIVERDDMPTSPQWGQTLAALGASVQVESWPGYAGMMTDPQRAVPPTAMVAGIVATLTQWRSALPGAVPGAVLPALGTSLEAEVFHETPVHIDTGVSQLFGVLTTGLPAAADKARAVVVLLNSGSVHHIGPNRLWVRLARQWASKGVVVLRLDLSGIGDSQPRPDAPANEVYSASAAMDVDAAVKYVKGALAANEYHVAGLCSGAYHAFKAAVAGQALTSVIMINPLTFFWTPGMSLDGEIKDFELQVKSKKYRQQLFSLEPWRKLVRGQLDLSYLGRFVARRVSAVVEGCSRKLARLAGVALANDLPSELAQVARNRVRQHFVFAVGDPGLELLCSQGGPGLEKLQTDGSIYIDRIAQADHTFTRLEARERLVVLLDGLLFDSEKYK